ncbi:sugar phosphate isomerase/epimerase [Halobacteriales archaeon QS_8_69_26]|nr:MAG: sugar phosphate isomerase/epimerase [Halobacteriales archaeon QS_8_69_26]
MEIGASVGPYLDDIPDLPDRFEFVEVSIGEGEVPPEEVDRDALRSDLAADDLDLMVHLPFRQPLATAVERIDEANLAYMTDLLDACEDLGARKAVVHVTARSQGAVEASEVIRSRLPAVMGELAAAGEDRGVEVCFENVGNVGGVALDAVGGLAAETDLPLCFDVGHAYAEHDNATIGEFLGVHGDRVSHLHVHDARARGDSHIPVGSGEVDYGVVADAIPEFDGTATVEVFTDDPDHLALSAEKFLDEF